MLSYLYKNNANKEVTKPQIIIILITIFPSNLEKITKSIGLTNGIRK